MATKYVRLQNGKKMKLYDIDITNACLLSFTDTDIDTIKDFLGTEIIDSIDIVDEEDKIISNHKLNMKRKTILCETKTVTKYEDRIVQEAYDEVVKVPSEDGSEETETTIHHDAITDKISKQEQIEVITAILEKPSFEEELDAVKSTVGIINTNNMTLDEFKSYYKGVIGKACTNAIENGVDVETVLGKKHFSYTIEDQSNVKDLIITAIFTDFTMPLPYHADGELCTPYEPSDIQKIYMSLCSNKTYHTTYCNVLNAMITEAKDMASVKTITYGMEITDKKYTEVMSKINESKDALLAYVEKKFNTKSE